MDMLTSMELRLATMIDKKFERMNLQSSLMGPQKAMLCDLYNGGQPNHECPSMGTSVEHVDFVQGNRQGNNSYSNIYNSGWRNHPNFSWANQKQQGPQNPPGFQNRRSTQSLPSNAPPSNPPPTSNLEDILIKFMSAIED